MVRITVDPNSLTRPDYTLEFYQETRNRLINQHTTEEQATILLGSIWDANNDAEKTLWEDQLTLEAEDKEERRREEEEEEALLHLERKKQKEDQRKEEMKKHKAKYILIPNRKIPNHPPVIAAQEATRRLEKGEYAQLWYWTNNGTKSARHTYNNVDQDAMTMRKSDDGSMIWMPASISKETKGLVEDQGLTLEEFCTATPRMLDAMMRADWPKERVQMMMAFWGGLQVHPYRYSADSRETRALILYQAEQRRLWHYAITSPNGGYDLSEINEELLRDAKDRIKSQDDDAERMDRETAVCHLKTLFHTEVLF